MFKTTYLVFYTSVFLTMARFSTYITNEVLWCSKNLYFKKLFYLRKTNSLYLEKLLLLLISNASSRMQSSSPHAGLVVFTAPKLRPRPAATASLPHGISFDETDSCRTLPKWNLCNQAFLCCSICLFFPFFSNIDTYSLLPCNPLWLGWISSLWCLMLHECWVVPKATPCFVCLHCWDETICAGCIFRGSCDHTYNATF